METEQGNKLIAEFFGGWHATADELFYHSSWDWIMPVCLKWDNMGLNHLSEYVELSQKLDFYAAQYEIEPLWRQLVKNIEWYNQSQSPLNQ